MLILDLYSVYQLWTLHEQRFKGSSDMSLPRNAHWSLCNAWTKHATTIRFSANPLIFTVCISCEHSMNNGSKGSSDMSLPRMRIGAFVTLERNMPPQFGLVLVLDLYSVYQLWTLHEQRFKGSSDMSLPRMRIGAFVTLERKHATTIRFSANPWSLQCVSAVNTPWTTVQRKQRYGASQECALEPL